MRRTFLWLCMCFGAGIACWQMGVSMGDYLTRCAYMGMALFGHWLDWKLFRRPVTGLRSE